MDLRFKGFFIEADGSFFETSCDWGINTYHDMVVSLPDYEPIINIAP